MLQRQTLGDCMEVAWSLLHLACRPGAAAGGAGWECTPTCRHVGALCSPRSSYCVVYTVAGGVALSKLQHAKMLWAGMHMKHAALVHQGVLCAFACCMAASGCCMVPAGQPSGLWQHLNLLQQYVRPSHHGSALAGYVDRPAMLHVGAELCGA